MRILDVASVPFWEIAYDSAESGGTQQAMTLPLVQGTVDALPAGVQALLVCSDLQGRTEVGSGAGPPPLLGEALAADLALLAASGEIAEARHIGILLLGDLFADAGATVRGAHGDVGAVWRAFATEFRWVVGVAGNHDLIGQPPVPEQENAHLLDGRVVTVDGMRIGGISGVIGAAKEGRAWRRDERSFVEAARVKSRANPDILLLHQGPNGSAPGQPGHPAIRAVLERAAPTLTLCGHVHWLTPVATLSGGWPGAQRRRACGTAAVELTAYARGETA